MRSSPAPNVRAARASASATRCRNRSVARSLALHRGDDIREFRGDLFVAAADAGYLLRVRFDPSDPLRALATEKLLEGRIGSVRAVAISTEGSIYVASDSALWRLARVR